MCKLGGERMEGCEINLGGRRWASPGRPCRRTSPGRVQFPCAQPGHETSSTAQPRITRHHECRQADCFGTRKGGIDVLPSRHEILPADPAASACEPKIAERLERIFALTVDAAAAARQGRRGGSGKNSPRNRAGPLWPCPYILRRVQNEFFSLN